MLNNWENLFVDKIPNRIPREEFLFAQKIVKVVVIDTFEFCHGGIESKAREYANARVDLRLHRVIPGNSGSAGQAGAKQFFLKNNTKKTVESQGNPESFKTF
jgi:hypothetical protein